MNKAMQESNPYNFTNPVRTPERFAGRKKELEEIGYYLELSKGATPQYTHIAIIGPRSVGKSSILNIIEHIANEKSMLPVKISLNNEMVKNDALFFKEIFDAIMTNGIEKGMYDSKIYKSFRKLLDTLDVKVSIPLYFGTAYIGLKKKEHEAGVPQSVLIHDLRELFKEAKSKNIPAILLLFDECDLLSQNETLLQKIRNVFMEVDGYVLLFCGTEKMFPKINDVFSPIPRFFNRINVGNFNFDETKECILKPLSEDEKKIVDLSSVADIHRFTGGSPYEINLVAHYMYKAYKKAGSQKIGLTVGVLDNVLAKLERLRKGETHEIADKIKRYWINNLRVLISLLEFPNVSQEWLSRYILLEKLERLTPNIAVTEREIANDIILQLKKDGVIGEKENKQLYFKGDQFDLLYLKYYAISRGIKDFFVGFPDSPIMNVYQKLAKILIDEFPEYNIHTKFDKREYLPDIDKKGRRMMFGVKGTFGPGEIIIDIPPKELDEKFYRGIPNSVRFRINVKYMNEGFVTQVTFKKEEDKEKLIDKLNSYVEKLEAAELELILKDEIAWNNEGVELKKSRKYEESMKCFDKALEIDPNFELPWVNKGGIYFEQKHYEKAIDCCEKALEVSPRFVGALITKGMALINLGKNDKALKVLEKAVELEPENWAAWDNKGRALFNLKRYKEAVKCFDKALKFNPNNIEILNLKGTALLNLKKFDEAIKCCEEVLNKDPNNELALANKASSLVHAQKYDDAFIFIDKLLKVDPKNTGAWVIKGFILYNLKKN